MIPFTKRMTQRIIIEPISHITAEWLKNPWTAWLLWPKKFWMGVGTCSCHAAVTPIRSAISEPLCQSQAKMLELKTNKKTCSGKHLMILNIFLIILCLIQLLYCLNIYCLNTIKRSSGLHDGFFFIVLQSNRMSQFMLCCVYDSLIRVAILTIQ